MQEKEHGFVLVRFKQLVPQPIELRLPHGPLSDSRIRAEHDEARPVELDRIIRAGHACLFAEKSDLRIIATLPPKEVLTRT